MSHQQVSVRFAHDRELTELTAIYNEARRPLACFNEPDVSSKQFSKLIQGEKVHVATVTQAQGTEVAGFVSVWVPQKFVHHLYVSPTYQNQHVAKALINTCVTCYGLPLGLKSLVANTRACAYYERNGWVIQETGEGVNGAYYFYTLENWSISR